MLAFHLKGVLAAVLAGAAAGIATASASGHVQDGWVVAGVLLVFAIVILVGVIRRLATTYTITNRRLTIDIGLLSRDLHQTRLERVQNVNTRQSLLERLLRVGSVDFDTAGESGFDFTFDGVAQPHRIVRTVDRALHELQQTGSGL